MDLLRKFFIIILSAACLIWFPAQSQANAASLAIFNFRAANIEALMYNSEILYSLISELEKEKSIKLMPRRKMEALLSQNNLAQSDHPAIVVKAGQALGADFILFGSIARQDGIVANMKLMDIANRQVVRTWKLRFTEPRAIAERMPLFASQLTTATSVLHGKETFKSGNPDAANTNAKSTGDSGRKPAKPEKKFSTEAEERLPYPPLVMSFSGRVRATEIKFVPALRNMKAHITIASYKIYRQDPAADEPTLIQTLNARASSSKIVFTIKDTHALKDGAVYRYALASVDKKGRESPRSDTIAVQTAPSPRLEIVQNKVPGQIELAWNPVANIKGYMLYRSLSDDGKNLAWERIAQIKDRHTEKYTDMCLNRPDGFSDGTLYRYRLTAYDDGGETAPSDIVEGRCERGGRSPSNDTALDDETAQDNRIEHPTSNIQHLTSNDTEDRIERSTSNIQRSTSNIEHPTSNDAEDRIERSTSNIEHPTSNDTPGLEVDNTSPGDIVALPGTPVLGVALDHQLRQIDLVWRTVGNTDGYHLYRKSPKTDCHKIATITATEKCYYSDTSNLEDGKTYQYYMTAFNSGEETEPSETVSARTKGLPPYPQGISALRKSNKGVNITWTPINDPDVGGYVIYRGTAAAPSDNQTRQSVSVKEIAQVKGWQSDAYIDQQIVSTEPDRKYYYAIKAFNLFNARGALSEAVRVKTEP